MNDNEIIKAFAELEGITIVCEHLGKLLIKDTHNGNIYVNGVPCSEYNPLKNYHLTFKAMLNYKVQKITDLEGYHTVHIDEHSRISCLTDNELQKGMIVCILKSKGLWTGTCEDYYND